MNHSSLSWSQLIHSISLLLSGTVLARLFTAIVLILIARQIGPAQFGQYTACFTIAWLTSPLFSLGLDSWLLGNGGRSGTSHALAVLASASLLLRIVFGMVWLLGMALLASLLDPNVFPPVILMLAAVTVWFDELGRLVWAVFETAMRNRTTLVLMVMMQALIFVAVGILFVHGEKQLSTYLLAQAAATALGSGVGIVWQIRQFGFPIDRSTLIPTVRSAIPFAVSVGLSLVYGRADIAIVAQWLGKAAAGLYAPAVSLISALALVPLAIYNVILPVFSRIYSQQQSQLGTIVRQTLLLSLLLGIAMGGGTVLLARPIVDLLYGADYQQTGLILMILSGVLVARSVNLSAAAALIALDQQSRRVRFQAVAAAFNIVANLIVLPYWGVQGVAVVFVLTESSLTSAYLFVLWQSLRSHDKSAMLSPSS